jgi:hypothetical protein
MQKLYNYLLCQGSGTLPFWFKAYLCLFLFTVLTSTVRRVRFEKTVRSIGTLSEEKREAAINSTGTLLKIYKFLFLSAPLYLLIIPFIMYVYLPHRFIYISAVKAMMYAVIIEEYHFSKKLLKRLKTG